METIKLLTSHLFNYVYDVQCLLYSSKSKVKFSMAVQHAEFVSRSSNNQILPEVLFFFACN
jgi:hypothetical protein